MRVRVLFQRGDPLLNGRSRANHKIWHDAQNIASLKQDSARTIAVAANNDPVGSLGDLSATGTRHASTGTTAQKPTYKTAGINNRPAILFDGVDDKLVYSVQRTYLTQNYFHCLVFQMAAGGTNLRMIYGDASAFTLLETYNYGGLRLRDWDSAYRDINIAPAFDTNPHVLIWWRDNSNLYAQVDGGTVLSIAQTGTNQFQTDQWGGSAPANFYFGEYILVSETPSADLRNAYLQALKGKWGFS